MTPTLNTSMHIIGQSCDHKSGLHRKPALGMAIKNRVG